MDSGLGLASGECPSERPRRRYLICNNHLFSHWYADTGSSPQYTQCALPFAYYVNLRAPNYVLKIW